MLETSAPASRREQAKAERRRRIVDAATALLRENGLDGVSMTLIAERAGVSPGTVYNLFETKGAVLQQVFDLDLQHYEALVARAPVTDALDRIFAAVDVAVSLYRDDPGFYRAMARGGARDAAFHPTVSKPRIGFWRRMVAQARAEGRLEQQTNAHLVGVTLSQTMRGALYEWAAEAISAERLGFETQYGFAQILIAHATPPALAALMARLAGLETQLSSRVERT